MGMGTYNVMCLLLGGGEYCFNCILCIYFLLKLVVHGRRQGHSPQHMLGVCHVCHGLCCMREC